MAFSLLCVGWMLAEPPFLDAQEALPEWTLEEDLRLLVIDSTATAFPDVRAVVVGADGQMHLGLYHLRTIRTFDREGRFVRTFGEVGNTPGAMRDLRHLGWIGDTLYVVEARRAVYFGADGEPRGDFERDRSPGSTPPRYERLLPHGGALFTSTVSGPTPDAAPIATLVLRGDREAIRVDTVLRVPHGERPEPLQLERGERAAGWPSPYLFHPLFEIAHDGSTLALLERPEARSSGEGTYSILAIDSLEGDTVFHRSYTYTPAPVDRAMVVSALARGFAPTLGVEAEELEGEIEDRLQLPSFSPPVTGLMVAAGGAVWVEMWRTPGLPAVWHVLDRHGEPVGTVELPPGGEIVRLGESSLHVTVREGRAMHLVRYRLVKAGSTP